MGGATKAVVLLSGGLDSTACVHMLLKKNIDVSAIHIDYGQLASAREAQAATAVAAHFGIKIENIAWRTSISYDVGELVGRNAFFILSALMATKGNANLIALGVHAGTPYHDCSPQFIEEISKLVAHQTNGRVKVFAPFVEWSKAEVHDYLLSASLPISITYSCERGTEPACGDCASCKDREVLGC